MNPKPANWPLLQRRSDVNLRQIQRIERRPVVFHFYNEIRSQCEPNLDLVFGVVRKCVAHEIREMFLKSEIGRLENVGGKLVVAAKLFQSLYDLLFFSRLIFEDDLQGRTRWQRKNRLRLFHQRFAKAGSCQHCIHFGRRARGEERPLGIFHLAPVLKQHAQARRTEECRAAEIDINILRSRPDDTEDFHLKLVGACPVNAS